MRKYNNYLNENKYEDINKFLLDVRHNKNEDVDIAIENIKDPNFRNKNGNTMFMILIYSSKNISEEQLIKYLQRLLDKGADINLADIDFKDTPLMMAAEYRKYDVVNFLIESGADWDLKNTDDRTFLDIIKRDRSDIYEEIIQKYPEKFKEYIRKQKSNEFNL